MEKAFISQFLEIIKHPLQVFEKCFLYRCCVKPLEPVILMTNCHLFMIHATTSSIEEIFLQYFLVILNASELLENIKEKFLQYYMHCNMSNMFKSSTTHWCVIRRKEGGV